MKGPEKDPKPKPPIEPKQESGSLDASLVRTGYSLVESQIELSEPRPVEGMSPEDLNLFVNAGLFGRDDLIQALQRMSQELERRGIQGTEIRVFGSGALMLAYTDSRRMSSDLDALTASSDMPVIAEQIREELNLPDDWFNQDVQAFDRPSLEFEEHKLPGCENLRIMVLSQKCLFAMKCFAGRDLKDTKDIAFLIEKLGVKSLKEADDIYAEFYPDEPMPELSMVKVLECCDWRYE